MEQLALCLSLQEEIKTLVATIQDSEIDVAEVPWEQWAVKATNELEVRAVALEDGATEDGWTPPPEIARLRVLANEEIQTLIRDLEERKEQLDSMLDHILKSLTSNRFFYRKAKEWTATLKDFFERSPVCIIQKVIDGNFPWKDPPEFELLQTLAEKSEEMDKLLQTEVPCSLLINIRIKYETHPPSSPDLICNELIKNTPRKVSADDERFLSLLSEHFFVNTWIGEPTCSFAILYGSFKLFKKFYNIIANRDPSVFRRVFNTYYCVEYAIVSRNIEILDFILSLDRTTNNTIVYNSGSAIKSALKIGDPQIIKRLQLVPEIQSSPELLAMLNQPSS